MNKYFFNEQNETTDGVKPILKDEVNNRTYELQKILGVGASCVVYKAKEGKRDCLIKELNPRGSNITRNDNGELICADERAKASFNKRLARFEESCEWQIEFRNISELKNHTGPIVSVFSANNTCYSEIVDFSATDYSKYTDKSLKELLERIRAITKVISIYHNKGYLHLDIKPANVLVFEQAEKMPILIDFDSITTKEEIMETGIASYSKDWAAYEQTDSECIYEIDKATDLFAIGEMLFFKLFARHSNTFERFGFSKFDFTKDNGLLKDIDHKIYPLLTEIFNHTICNSISSRYQTAEELIEKLDKAIELADPKRAFLPACYLNTKDFFVGRDNELAEIEQKLKECDELYVSGFGGIGKSELVRQYAKLHKSEFDSIVYVTFKSDVKSMLANIRINDINLNAITKQRYELQKKINTCTKEERNKIQQALETLINQQLQENLKRLQEFKSNGEKILFIVDNFDTELVEEDDQLFGKFVSCAEKTIVTTRNTDIDGKTVISIGAIENLRAIFDHHYGRQLSLEEDKAVNEILDIFQGHTLATELLAKQMKASRIVPSLMLERLESKGLREIGNEKVKYGNKKNNAYNFIKEIFDISKLTDDEIYVLVNLSLIIPDGIDAEVFYDFCNLKTYEHIDVLAERGLIYKDKNDVISLHPLIAEIMLEELEKDSDKCSNLLYSIVNSDINTAYRFDVFETTNYICNKFFKLSKYSKSIVDFCIRATRLSRGYGMEGTYIRLLENILVYIEKERNIDDSTLSGVFNELGTMYSYKQEYIDAEKCYLCALFYAKKSNSYETNYLMALYCNLMEIYRYMEEYDKAKELFKQSAITCKREYDEETYRAADMHSVCGAICQDLNENNDAENHYKMALEIRVRTFGENHDITSYSYADLGNLYYHLKQFDGAKGYYKKALDIKIKLYGSNYGDVARLYLNLAEVEFEQGNIEESDDCCYEALKITDKIYEDNHPDTADVLYQVALIFRERKETDKAIAMLKEVNEMYISYFGSEYEKRIAKVYATLGEAYETDKQYLNAKESYLKSLVIRKKLFDPNHVTIRKLEGILKQLEKLIAEKN